MLELISSEHLTALLQVVMIDLVLAGDNAIVIGLAAAGLPKDLRAKAILIGIVAATVLRIGFASVTVQLLQIIGLLLAGGVLLLWVCWKMWRELRTPTHHGMPGALSADGHHPAQDLRTGDLADRHRRRVNVARQRLAVAGAARDRPDDSGLGLALSIALMGVAASVIAHLLERHRSIAYVGLAIILYVAAGHGLSRRAGGVASASTFRLPTTAHSHPSSIR